MIEQINLLNPMALNKYSLDCNNVEIYKIMITNNDPTLEIKFKFEGGIESIFVDISFIGVDDLLIKNISLNNIVKDNNILNDYFEIHTLNLGTIQFKYEWGRVESIKKIKEGTF